MTAYTWAGKSSGNWSTPANWLVGSIPATYYPGGPIGGTDTTTDTVTIDSSNTVTLDVSVTIKSLTFGDSAGTFKPTLALGANTLAVTQSGTTLVNPGASITLQGGSFVAPTEILYIQPGATVSGYGTIDVQRVSYGGTNDGSVVASGGALTVETTAAYGINYVPLSIDSSTASELQIEGSAYQNGPILLDSANQTLEIGAAAVAGVPPVPAAAGFLNISGSAQEISGGATVLLAGGSATIADPYGIFLSGGYLTGSGSVGQVKTPTVPYPVQTTLYGAGTVTAEGGSLTFYQPVDLIGTATTFDIDSGAKLVFDGSVGLPKSVVGTPPVTIPAINPSINFQTGATAIETMDLSGAPSATFYGNVNYFTNNAFGSDQMLVGGSATDNTITITNASRGVYISGPTTGYNFVTVTDPDITSGSKIIDVINMNSYTAAADVGFLGSLHTTLVTTDVICFMAGTMIRTPDGEVAVETLKRGDLVLTAEGLAQPVCWLGRQTVSTRFADPLRVLPIRIKAGALGDNVPCRDLLLSPDHAVLVDGALIHAGALVNDASILRETAVPEIFTYYHVELDDHSLVLAENTPAETFVDNVERLAFDNWAEHDALYPEGKAVTELPYPRAKGRRQVPVYIRVFLAARAEIIGASTIGVMVA